MNTGPLKIRIIIHKIYFFVALRAKSGLGRLFLSFLDHTVRCTKPLGLLWTSDQPVTEDSTTQKTNIHILGGTRTHVPKKELLTHVLDHTANGIRLKICYAEHIPCVYNKRTGQHFMLHGLKNTMFQEKKMCRLSIITI